MKFIKLFSLIFVISAAMYLAGCTSAEQTTAKLAYQQGDYEKAAREFEKETKQNPMNEEAWFYLAMSNAKLNKPEGVKTAIEQYRKIGKNSFNTELTNEWGTQYDEGYKAYTSGEGFAKANKETEALREFNNALKYFNMAYTLLPDSAFVKNNISAINNRINTISVKPYIDKGVELEKSGDYSGAIAEYSKALSQVTKGSGAYEVVIYNISVANLKWGEQMRTANSEDPAYKAKYQDALPYLEELTLSSDKDNQLNAWELLVQVYGNLGMTEKATDAIKKRDELKNK
jgi:tetratricopeptide (TPR) repeat protein